MKSIKMNTWIEKKFNYNGLTIAIMHMIAKEHTSYKIKKQTLIHNAEGKQISIWMDVEAVCTSYREAMKNLSRNYRAYVDASEQYAIKTIDNVFGVEHSMKEEQTKKAEKDELRAFFVDQTTIPYNNPLVYRIYRDGQAITAMQKKQALKGLMNAKKHADFYRPNDNHAHAMIQKGFDIITNARICA